MTSTRRVLRLAEADNVWIVTVPLLAGEVVALGDTRVRIPRAVEVGHKVAGRPIAAGEKIVRLGMPIGSATCDIAAGEWVHTHNLASDYIRTFDRRGGEDGA